MPSTAFAVERGTALTAIGYSIAGIASVVSILVVGSGMFIGAYSGLVHKAVDERTLQANGTALINYAGVINQAALDAGRAGPALHLVASDLTQFAACERKNSCLSKVGQGGFGPVASKLQALAGRAQAIANTFDKGETTRRRILSDINKLNTRYQDTLNDSAIDLNSRRAILQTQHAEIEQAAASLSEALPLSLLRTYAQELQEGVSIPGQLDASTRLNDLLRQHGDTLMGSLATLGREKIDPPAFPLRPGMLDSLKFISEFAAFAAVIFVAELVLPLTLWVLTYSKLAWEIERRTPNQATQKEEDGFNGLIDLPPVVPVDEEQAEKPKPARRTRSTAS